MTYVDWHRDASNNNSIKYSREEAIKSITAGTNLALPIFKDVYEMEGDISKSEYIYVPLVPSNYLAFFIKSPSEKELGNSASKIVIQSIFDQLPIFAFATVVTALAGILLWAIVSKFINTS